MGTAGVLMGLAPVNAWPLAWVALAPLWWGVQHVSQTFLGAQSPAQQSSQPPVKRQLLALLPLPLCWSLGYHGTALSWILHLHPLTWMGIPWLGSIAISLFAWAAITIWGMVLVSLWALGLATAQRYLPDAPSRILVGTALWCGLEALWNLSPLDWTTLAYTQSPGNLVILHLGQIAGPLTVSALLVAVNGVLAETVRTGSWRSGGAIALTLCLTGHLIGFTLYQQPLNDPPEQAIPVGIIQGNIPTRQKLSAEGVRRSRDVYLQGYRDLAQVGVEAVLTPEGAVPVLFDTAQKETDLFYRLVSDQPITAPVLWLGQFLLEPVDRDHITQSLISIVPQQGIVGQYDKIKLVPLGEYIPLQSVFGKLISRLSPIGTDMIPGGTQQQFETGLGPAAGGICFDSAFSWLFRRQVAHGGEFILTASNIDPYPRRTMIQLHGHEVMRAIETSRWAARATNTGLSSIIDAHGQTVWLSTANQTVIHADTLYRRQHHTPYVRWGNWLTPLLVGLSLCRLWLNRIQPEPRSFPQG